MPEEPIIDAKQVQERSDLAYEILVREFGEAVQQPPDAARYLLDGLALVLSGMRPQEMFAMCGNLIQHGLDMRKRGGQ